MAELVPVSSEALHFRRSFEHGLRPWLRGLSHYGAEGLVSFVDTAQFAEAGRGVFGFEARDADKRDAFSSAYATICNALVQGDDFEPCLHWPAAEDALPYLKVRAARRAANLLVDRLVTLGVEVEEPDDVLGQLDGIEELVALSNSPERLTLISELCENWSGSAAALAAVVRVFERPENELSLEVDLVAVGGGIR